MPIDGSPVPSLSSRKTTRAPSAVSTLATTRAGVESAAAGAPPPEAKSAGAGVAASVAHAADENARAARTAEVVDGIRRCVAGRFIELSLGFGTTR